MVALVRTTEDTEEHGGARRAVRLSDGELRRASGEVVDSAMKVHSTLGPGPLESAYETCLAHELARGGLEVRVQVPVPLVYEGVRVEVGYRIDLLVDGVVVVEIKAVTKLLPIHEAQLLSYLRLSGRRVGLLINFHSLRLKDGIKRIMNGW